VHRPLDDVLIETVSENENENCDDVSS